MKSQLCVGDSVPLVLTIAELANLLRVSEQQVRVYIRRRNHPAIKPLEGPGHPRFCGRTVKAWLDGGESQPMRRRFFAAGAR